MITLNKFCTKLPGSLQVWRISSWLTRFWYPRQIPFCGCRAFSLVMTSAGNATPFWDMNAILETSRSTRQSLKMLLLMTRHPRLDISVDTCARSLCTGCSNHSNGYTRMQLSQFLKARTCCFLSSKGYYWEANWKMTEARSLAVRMALRWNSSAADHHHKGEFAFACQPLKSEYSLSDQNSPIVIRFEFFRHFRNGSWI